MGLKLNKPYEVKDMGITVPSAYAKITSIDINNQGMATAVIDIQLKREDILNKGSLETIVINKKINKEEPIYRQLYIAAKEEIFADWEDDIIEIIENN